MKKKQLKLADLKLTSFVTKEINSIKGGNCIQQQTCECEETGNACRFRITDLAGRCW